MSYQETVVKVTKGGEVYFLYNDGSPLIQLGSCAMQRASNVVWNEKEQGWEVIFNIPTNGEIQKIPNGTIFKDRSEAVQFEVKLLSKYLFDGLNVEDLFSPKDSAP
jgi:hypothetical protein